MKILKLFFVIFFIFSFNNLAANTDDMKIKITKNLRCLICQGQSVYDSDSEFANSMKVLVDKKLKDGLSENQIYDFFKEKYGQWILYDPELNKNTYILWLLPILIFLIGGAIVVKNFKFRK
ncbi:cytochrome c-type biogenesis protein CcmH [Candidatus Pelagibacter sp.]|nr:cytochrome c-type biogenesis protein CcmH [Candidatus Pelagibacter sp.]